MSDPSIISARLTGRLHSSKFYSSKSLTTPFVKILRHQTFAPYGIHPAYVCIHWNVNTSTHTQECQHIYPYTGMSTHLPIYTQECQHIYPYTGMSTYLPIHRNVNTSTHTHAGMSTHLPIHWNVNKFTQTLLCK